MRALAFWKRVTVDQTNLLESLISLLSQQQVQYCVIGGQAVNAYVDPLVSLDLDLVIASEQIVEVERLFGERFEVESLPHGINVSQPGSNLRIQIQKDPRYLPFLQCATTKEVLGLALPVATLEDVLQGKIWAVTDPERCASKRQEDLADIARIIEAYPQLRSGIPVEILARLL